MCECCTWGLRSLLAPSLLRFLTVPNQSGMHRGSPETGTSCPSVLPLSTGVGVTLGLQSLSVRGPERKGGCTVAMGSAHELASDQGFKSCPLPHLGGTEPGPPQGQQRWTPCWNPFLWGPDLPLKMEGPAQSPVCARAGRQRMRAPGAMGRRRARRGAPAGPAKQGQRPPGVLPSAGLTRRGCRHCRSPTCSVGGEGAGPR